MATELQVLVTVSEGFTRTNNPYGRTRTQRTRTRTYPYLSV